LELSPNEKDDFRDNHLKKIEFLQLSHAIEIPCNYLGQVAAVMQLHWIIFELNIQYDCTIYTIRL
jgi:hypothetical protein